MGPKSGAWYPVGFVLSQVEEKMCHTLQNRSVQKCAPPDGAWCACHRPYVGFHICGHTAVCNTCLVCLIRGWAYVPALHVYATHTTAHVEVTGMGAVSLIP